MALGSCALVALPGDLVFMPHIPLDGPVCLSVSNLLVPLQPQHSNGFKNLLFCSLSGFFVVMVEVMYFLALNILGQGIHQNTF